MNNWKAVGYIFIGFGSVFLGYALISFLALTALSSAFLNFAPVALAVNAPWFVIAALAYVVGFVGYFAGKEDIVTSIAANEAKVERTQELESEFISDRVDSFWSVPIGVLVIFIIIILQIVLGFWNPADMIFGVAFPILYSIVAGSIVGLVALLLIDRINK